MIRVRHRPRPAAGGRRLGGGRWRRGVLLVVASVVAPLLEANAQSRSTVRGVVFDSVGRTVLPGALVQFVGVGGPVAGLAFATSADSAGRYRLEGLPPGSYLAGFFHAAADSLGVEADPRRVTVRRAQEEVDLAAPSAASLAAALCPRSDGTDAATLLLGHVRDAASEAPVDLAVVRVEWLETTLDRGGVRTRERGDSAVTRASGFFSMCGLPSDLSLLGRVARGADSTGYVELDVPATGLRHVTFYLGGATRRVVSTGAGADSAGAPIVRWSGRTRLTGAVRDALGDPVDGARATLLGAGVEGVANARGTFVLDSLPAGTFTLEVRAIGYAPVRRTVQLREGGPNVVAVELGARLFTLPTMIVRGELVYSRQLAGFERRRRTEFTGRFLTPREIQARPRTRLSWLLQDVPGVVVTRRGPYALVVMRRVGASPGLEYCGPSLWIDGVADPTADFDRIWSDELAAVEVYASPAQRPFEFSDRSECGAVAVWLRPRVPPPR